MVDSLNPYSALAVLPFKPTEQHKVIRREEIAPQENPLKGDASLRKNNQQQDPQARPVNEPRKSASSNVLDARPPSRLIRDDYSDLNFKSQKAISAFQDVEEADDSGYTVLGLDVYA